MRACALCVLSHVIYYLGARPEDGDILHLYIKVQVSPHQLCHTLLLLEIVNKDEKSGMAIRIRIWDPESAGFS